MVASGSQEEQVETVEIQSYTKCGHTQGTPSGSDEGWIEMKRETRNGTTCWEANVVPDHPITKFRINGKTEDNLDGQGITPLKAKINTITLTVGTPHYTIDQTTGAYTVHTAKGLQAWADHVNNGKWNTDCTLADDITLIGTNNWIPVSNVNDDNYYSGVFDGAGHSITGINISTSASQGNQGIGLFGYLSSSGTVKNLTLKDANITVTGYSRWSVYAGGIVGHSMGGTISGCHFSGTISCTSSAWNSCAGGITGQSDNESKIIGCSSSGTITASAPTSSSYASYAGGIAGNISTATYTGSSLIGCWSTASTTATGGNAQNAGTFCGGATDATFTACYFNGNQGIGNDGGGNTGSPTQISNGDWSTAMEAMNQALSSYGIQWVKNEGADQNTVPLILNYGQ